MKEIKQLIRLDWETSQELKDIKKRMEEKTINKTIKRMIKETKLLYEKIDSKNMEIKTLRLNKIYRDNNGY